jgi:hypothetical protein
MINLNSQSFFRFDKSWTDNPEIIELFVKWWSEFKLCEKNEIQEKGNEWAE